jgi:hypothetical protein
LLSPEVRQPADSHVSDVADGPLLQVR